MYLKVLFFLSLMVFVNAHEEYEERISGGYQAGIGQFPYQVSIQYKSIILYYDFCDGALIKENYVLTSARCIVNSKMRVKAGFIKKSARGAKYMNVIAKTAHPNFNLDKLENDIALLKLEQNFALDDTIGLIGLPVANSVPSGNGTLAGWGATTSIFGLQSNSLNYAMFSIITQDACKTAVGTQLANLIQNSTTCAQSTRSNACFGDGGGSLVQDNYTVGVFSWTRNGCSRNGGTLVFTRVSSYITWINGILNA